jgi:hypothetical protein
MTILKILQPDFKIFPHIASVLLKIELDTGLFVFLGSFHFIGVLWFHQLVDSL